MPFQPTSPTKSDFLLDESNDELDRLNEELAIAAQKLKLAQSRTEELEFSNQRLQDTCEELRIQTRKQAEEIIGKSAKVSSLENIQRELTAGRKSDDSDRHKLEEEA
jgi:chromosome segregation ATPase